MDTRTMKTPRRIGIPHRETRTSPPPRRRKAAIISSLVSATVVVFLLALDLPLAVSKTSPALDNLSSRCNLSHRRGVVPLLCPKRGGCDRKDGSEPPDFDMRLRIELRGGAAWVGRKGSDGVEQRSVGDGSEASISETTRRRVTAQASVALVLVIVLSALNWNAIKATLSPLFDQERFRTFIISRMNRASEMGYRGLAIYATAFVFYEACGLPTSVVETAAGMAFGFRRGLLGSFIGKTGGSLFAFALGRTLLSKSVRRRAEENETLGLIKRSVGRNPFRSAMIVRYSPFPQLIKNFGLSVMDPVTASMFLTVISIHGFPFSVLWAALGYDSNLRLRAADVGESMEANVILNALLIFVTFFGFVITPVVTGWWIADLRRNA